MGNALLGRRIRGRVQAGSRWFPETNEGYKGWKCHEIAHNRSSMHSSIERWNCSTDESDSQKGIDREKVVEWGVKGGRGREEGGGM